MFCLHDVASNHVFIQLTMLLLRACCKIMVKLLNLYMHLVLYCFFYDIVNGTKNSPFNFLTEYTIVQNKIMNVSSKHLVVEISTLSDVLLYRLSLYKSNKPIIISELQTAEDNSTVLLDNPDISISYYQGRVSVIGHNSHLHPSSRTLVHGTLYYDLAFEGVIHVSNQTFHLEAVDRYQTENKSYSVLYETDDLYQHTGEGIDYTNTYYHESDDGFNFMPYLKRDYRLENEKTRSNRKKRFTTPDYSQIKFCNVHAVIDGYFNHYMAADSKQEAAKLVAQVVHQSNDVFLQQDFDGDNMVDNIGIVLSAMTFIDKVFGFNYLKTEKSPAHFLEVFTTNYHFPDTCVGMVFTFQDFGPTLGMAWVAKVTRPPRTGIGSPKNQGFVTCLLYGQRLTTRSIVLTLTHELGHSFGSSHDPTTEGHQCAPGDAQGGKYVMYPTSSKGDMPNNYIFSPCSKNSINIIIGVRSLQAFSHYQSPYCGNGHIEEGEECDCGTPLSCKSLDQCCVPAGEINECQLQRELGAVCSPVVHSCCSASCQIIPAAAYQICGGVAECLEESFCDGAHYECPQPKITRSGTVCDNGHKVCDDGHCQKSICTLAGLESCQCESVAYACKVCCQTSSPDTKCQPVEQIEYFKHGNISNAIWLDPGTLCLNKTGFCNEFHLCVRSGVDYVSVLGLKVIKEEVVKWAEESWMFLMAFIAVVVAFYAIFFCAKPTTDLEITNTFRAGHMSRVLAECKRHQEQLNEQIYMLNTDFIKFEKGEKTLVAALSRLMFMFPLTSVYSLFRVMRGSANEVDTVKKLILLNHPIRAYNSGLRALKSEMVPPAAERRANEQYGGKVTIKMEHIDMMTPAKRKELNITIPHAAEARNMVDNYKGKLVKGALNFLGKQNEPAVAGGTTNS